MIARFCILFLVLASFCTAGAVTRSEWTLQRLQSDLANPDCAKILQAPALVAPEPVPETVSRFRTLLSLFVMDLRGARQQIGQRFRASRLRGLHRQYATELMDLKAMREKAVQKWAEYNQKYLSDGLLTRNYSELVQRLDEVTLQLIQQAAGPEQVEAAGRYGNIQLQRLFSIAVMLRNSRVAALSEIKQLEANAPEDMDPTAVAEYVKRAREGVQDAETIDRLDEAMDAVRAALTPPPAPETVDEPIRAAE
jgi:hypothetical protein